jgi:hypothetical protein
LAIEVSAGNEIENELFGGVVAGRNLYGRKDATERTQQRGPGREN